MPGHKTPAKKASSKQKRSRSTAKFTPASRVLRYELQNSSNAGTETSHFIDLAKDLSVINRRLYRQGRDYHVKKITIVSSNTPNGDNRISVSTVPYNWVSQMAWKRSRDTWNEMNKVATQQISGNIAGTWADFKVHMTNTSRTATLARPMDNGGTLFKEGEWTHSQLVTPDGTTGEDSFLMHMLGGHDGSVGAWNSVGLIKSYGESRATVQSGDPNVPSIASDDPLVNVFDYGTAIDEVIDDLEFTNDDPPYDIDDYPGDDTNGAKPTVVQDTTLVDGSSTMAGFTAFLGLLEFEIKSSVENDNYSVLIELSPGKYRGIKADVI
jgi:hypothetical protein